MSDELENLEKQFILNEDLEHNEIKSLIARTMKFCKNDYQGHIIFQGDGFKMADKIMLALTARYLGNRLQVKLGREKPLSEQMSIGELSEALREKQEVVTARLKDLKDDKRVIPTEKGTYKVAPYAIGPFLTGLELNRK